MAQLACRKFRVAEENGISAVLEAEITVAAFIYMPFLRLKIRYTVLAEGGMVVDTHAEQLPYRYNDEEKGNPPLPPIPGKPPKRFFLPPPANCFITF